MIIVLPPSETKTRPATGPALDLDELSSPALHPHRRTMVRAAQRTAAGREGAKALGVPAGSPELVDRMARLVEEPAAPALEVYSGVLYDALGPARPRRAGQVLITSALLGVVDAATDRIPAYRLSASSALSRLGRAGSWWRRHLASHGAELAGQGELVIDCRSGAYRTMMPVPGAVQVSAVREAAGRRTVISHDAKRYRGLLAGLMLDDGARARSIEDVAGLAREGLPDGLGIEVQGDTLVVVDRG